MKLFIITSRVPWPLDKGDKLRIYHQIRYLSKSYDIELVALSSKKNNDKAKTELEKYCKKVHFFHISAYMNGVGVLKAFFSNMPMQIGYFYNRRINSQIQVLINESNPDFVFGQLIRVAEYMRQIEMPKVLDLQDALSKGLQRRALKSKGIMKYVLNFEYKRVLAYEKNELDDFHALSIITQTDKDLLPSRIQNKTKIVPNGVDLNFFREQDIEKKYDIVFTGNMSYAPNVMAAIFLINEIMPLVWKERKQATVLLAGSSPHSEVQALSNERVSVSGWLDDIRVAYAESRIFVAPMQIGIGLQNKLLEAMAMNMPCVTTKLANNALNAENGNQILVSDDNNAKQFANHILRLMEDKKLVESIKHNGYTFVKNNYDWKSAVDKLEKLF
ncbi:MAG: glycosyltransferase [Bacteroidales bacterium]|nr:glycosyltransferase [Bacteroidales bacterium]